MLVIDTNVLVAAFRSKNGASFRIMQGLLDRELEAAASTALLLEYDAVLRRDPNLRRFWISEKEVELVLATLAKLLVPIDVRFKWRPQLRDPDDELVLECAINAPRGEIVTFNRRDFLPEAKRFGIAVLSPGDIARRADRSGS